MKVEISVTVLAVVMFVIMLARRIRRERANLRRTEHKQIMDKDAYLLAKARHIYRRNHKENSKDEILVSRFGVEVPTDMRSDK